MGTIVSGGSDKRHVEKFRYKDPSGRESTTLDFVSKEIVPTYGQRRGVAACSSLRGISKQYIG